MTTDDYKKMHRLYMQEKKFEKEIEQEVKQRSILEKSYKMQVIDFIFPFHMYLNKFQNNH